MNRVSIIIPVYNVEKYIRNCLDSVLGQTYKNLEIILINDGSTDNSLSICMEYKKKDSRVLVISQTNQGLSGARNSGIELASGDYITFVDSDDYVANDYIEELLSVINESTYISACASKIVYDYLYDKRRKRSNVDEDEKNTYYDVHDYLQKSFGDVRYLSAWGKLYKRDLFKTIRFPIGKLHEDIFIMADLLMLSPKVAYINKEKYFYVKRLNSITTSKFTINKFDLIIANREFINKVISKYPDLKFEAKIYEIHAKSSLIKQMTRKDAIKNKTFVNETIQEARNNFGSVIKKKNISSKEKILVFITGTNYALIKFCWYLFDLVREKRQV